MQPAVFRVQSLVPIGRAAAHDMPVRDKTALKKIEDAYDLMEAGHEEQARALVYQVMNDTAAKKSDYGYAVDFFIVYEMYEDALHAIAAYKQKTGKALRGDPGPDEIRRLQAELLQKRQQLDSDEVKVLDRLSFRDRGHFSNYLTLRPVTKIRIFKDKICITKRGKERCYFWSQIEDCRIETNKAYKGYGMAAAVEITQKTMALKTPDGTYKFDVSSQMPDFGYGKLLVIELRRHLVIREVKIKKQPVNQFWTAFLALAVALAVLWALWGIYKQLHS